MIAKLRPHLFTVPLYLALVIILTWPLLPNLVTSFPSPHPLLGGDPNMYIWLMDWLAKTWTGQIPLPPSQMIYYPVGVNLSHGYDGLLLAAIGAPLVLLTHNPILSYNLIILISFVATALVTYALVFYLTHSKLAGAIGGLIFGFSPYLLIRALQHPNLCLLMAVPLLALVGLRFCQAPSLKRGWWLAGAVLLTALSSWYYLLSGIIFLGLLAILSWRNLLSAKTPSLLTLFLVATAILLPALPIILTGANNLKIQTEQFLIAGSAQVPNFVLPHPFTIIFGQFTNQYYRSWPSLFGTLPNYFEATSYFGLPLILLLLILFWKRKTIAVSKPGLLVGSLVLFTVLAMGPKLHLAGGKFPLPFALLQEFFPFNLFRVPNRMFVYALLAATILAGFLIAHYKQSINKKRNFAFIILLGVLLVTERLMIPYPLAKPSVSSFYQKLSVDHGVYAIADLPINYPGISLYNFYQITHGKPITGGEFFYLAYTPQTFSFLQKNELLRNSYCGFEKAALLEKPDRQKILHELAETKIRYIVVHNFLLHESDDCAAAGQYIRNFFTDTKPVFADGEITVYETYK